MLFKNIFSQHYLNRRKCSATTARNSSFRHFKAAKIVKSVRIYHNRAMLIAKISL